MLFGNTYPYKPTLIAIGSGKGGVGKSVLAAALGAGISMLKRKVIVIDADFGGSNLHQVAGIPRPAYTYLDFQSGHMEKLNDIVVEHSRFENLGFIFGAAGSYGMANEKFFNRQKFIRQLRGIDAEFVLIDLGAGSSFQVLDLFSAADFGIVVMNPDPLSLSESFNFVKQIVIRNLSNTLRKYPEVQTYVQEFAKTETFRANTRVSELIAQIEKRDSDVAAILKQCIDGLQIGLILNKVNDDEQITEIQAFQKALQDLLAIQTDLLGLVHHDSVVSTSLTEGIPFIAKDPKASASRNLADIIIMKLLHRSRFHAFFDRISIKKSETEISAKKVICSIHCMYWEECGYRQGGYPCKMHYMSEMGFQGET